MKIFIVDNAFLDVADFLEAIHQIKWTNQFFQVLNDEPDIDGRIRSFLQEVCAYRPDIVVLDAALTATEEELLDVLELEGKEVLEDRLSGFRFCRALVSERLGIPIVFLTKNAQGRVARTAMRVGADRVLPKDFNNEELIGEIKELVKSKTPHDSAFYWPLRDELDSDNDMWQKDVSKKALDRFYMNLSSVRRFGLFTASLRGILSPLFRGNADAEKKLMLSLVKSQVLLSLVDPRLRDHVKHTGNVFWVGYRLLHEIPEFKEPQSLSGNISKLYAPGDLSPRDQLLHTWTLAALFHDFGYVDERQTQLIGLVKSLVPEITLLEKSEARNEPTWSLNMKSLRAFAQDLLGHDHFLFHFIDDVITSFGSNVKRGDKSIELIDHGFLSAHRLLDMIPLDKLDTQMKNIVLHAALAIAYHNYVEILHKWKLSDKCKGTLPIGTLPICSLLAFCDNIQTWDRESEVDPALSRTQEYDGLLERLILSDTSYVSGSEIREFSTIRRDDKAGYDIKIRLRYFVEAAGGIDDVCENLGDGIKNWIASGRLKEVCEMTGMSSILQGQIVYELPMRAGIRTVTF